MGRSTIYLYSINISVLKRPEKSSHWVVHKSATKASHTRLLSHVINYSTNFEFQILYKYFVISPLPLQGPTFSPLPFKLHRSTTTDPNKIFHAPSMPRAYTFHHFICTNRSQPCQEKKIIFYIVKVRVITHYIASGYCCIRSVKLKLGPLSLSLCFQFFSFETRKIKERSHILFLTLVWPRRHLAEKINFTPE